MLAFFGLGYYRSVGQAFTGPTQRLCIMLRMSLRRFAKKEILWMVAGLIILTVPIVLLLRNVQQVSVVDYGPQRVAAPDVPIEITFDVPMSPDIVEAGFSIKPGVAGNFTWTNEYTLQFTPNQSLIPGQRYQVTLQAGVTSQDGRRSLHDDLQFEFTVRWPKVLFLAPASGARPQLMLHDLETGHTEQITDEQRGLTDYFAVSPNGIWVAYVPHEEGRASNIWAINLDTRQQVQLTNCIEVNAQCYTPVWRYDSTQLAYTRRELDTSSGWENTDHVWLVDIATKESGLLFDDLTQQSRHPLWSPATARIGVVLDNPQGILIYDFPSTESVFIPSQQGFVGAFSPQGDRLIYPILRTGPAVSMYYTHLEMVNLSNFDDEEIFSVPISGDAEAPLEDMAADFHPDAQKVVLTRRLLDERYTRGGQVFILDLDTMETEELIYEPIYSHGSLDWSPDGHLLVMQRYNFQAATDETEIWVYEMATGELRQIYQDGFLPEFVP